MPDPVAFSLHNIRHFEVPTVSCFLLHCTDSYNHTPRQAGTRCVSISVCTRIYTRWSWTRCVAEVWRRARSPPSKTHVDEARNCGLHSTALLAVRRFNWRSPMKHSSTSKMNYHRDTHVFTDDKDIFHVVNPPGARLRSTMHSRVIQYLPWNYVHSSI